MENFFMLLSDIDDQIKRMRIFWTTPHAPHLAVAMIQTMTGYEEQLCRAISDGAPDEQAIAFEAYQNLIPLLRYRAYQIEETSSPEEAEAVFVNDS